MVVGAFPVACTLCTTPLIKALSVAAGPVPKQCKAHKVECTIQYTYFPFSHIKTLLGIHNISTLTPLYHKTSNIIPNPTLDILS